MSDDRNPDQGRAGRTSTPDGAGGGRAKYLTRGGPPSDADLVVTMTRGQLRELVREAARLANAPEPLLVSRTGLAERLGCSPSHIDGLRKRGLPTVMVGEAVRFEPPVVLAWLRKNSGDAAA